MTAKEFVLEKYPAAYAAEKSGTKSEALAPWRWVIKPGTTAGATQELGVADSEDEAWAVAKAALEPTSAEEIPPEDLPAE